MPLFTHSSCSSLQVTIALLQRINMYGRLSQSSPGISHISSGLFQWCGHFGQSNLLLYYAVNAWSKRKRKIKIETQHININKRPGRASMMIRMIQSITTQNLTPQELTLIALRNSKPMEWEQPCLVGQITSWFCKTQIRKTMLSSLFLRSISNQQDCLTIAF